jgi:hypothetical protein
VGPLRGALEAAGLRVGVFTGGDKTGPGSNRAPQPVRKDRRKHSSRYRPVVAGAATAVEAPDASFQQILWTLGCSLDQVRRQDHRSFRGL